ncbi:MAG: hypothetical protein A3E87_06875 [Gammaproteobacteria bacterium RIFCSPHIGHO2_12_FULL_35_23]|nr:MAG: hypothetical protein A3E87_06875 [Gammaproteobacteria bacterium RIFCSPHIGHO2_12_FULL_35_23]
MSFIKVNGINIFYEQQGKGPDLILIAGVTADHMVWRNIIDQLAQSFKVTVFDNRGAGQSDAPDEKFTIDTMADDVVALMDGLKINKAIVLGHSMGGFILQSVLARYPEKFTKAIILCSRILSSSAYSLHAQVNAELTNRGVAKEIIAKNMATFIFGENYLQAKENITNYIKQVLANPYPQTLVGFNRQVEAIASFDKMALLPKIKTPLCAIYGGTDLVASPKNIDFLKSKISNLQAHILEGCGHMPQFEVPALLVKLIEKYGLAT